jgi:hypothetical protein
MTISISQAVQRELRVRSGEITLLRLERILFSPKTSESQKQAALTVYEQLPVAA